MRETSRDVAGGSQRDTERQSLLTRLSGADARVLRHSPSDWTRYSGLGGAVLFTASIAGLSMFIATQMALHASALTAGAVAFVWFLGIVNLDRWLVNSMGRGPAEPRIPWDDPAPGGGLFRVAAPRVVLALLFGLVISTPLTLQIFDPEIQTEIQKIHQDDMDQESRKLREGSTGQRISRLQERKTALAGTINSGGDTVDVDSDPQVAKLTSRIDELQGKYNALDEKATCERVGTRVTRATCENTTGKPGAGQFYQHDIKERDQVGQQMKQLKAERAARRKELSGDARSTAQERVAAAKKDLATVTSELDELQGGQNAAAAAFHEANQSSTGLLIRLKALIRASEGSPITFMAHVLLWLFFTTIDCLPVFVKLFSNTGTYEELLEEQKEQDKLHGRRAIRADARIAAADFEDDFGFHEGLREERRKSIQTLVKIIAQKEFELARGAVAAWHAQAGRQMAAGGASSGASSGPSAGTSAGKAQRPFPAVMPGSKDPSEPPVLTMFALHEQRIGKGTGSSFLRRLFWLKKTFGLGNRHAQRG